MRPGYPSASHRISTRRGTTPRASAKREGAQIYWADEMGLRSDHVRGTSYGKRGRTPIVPGSAKRFGCQMLSALTNSGHLLFMVFKGRFERLVFLRFLRRLVRQVRRKIFLIVDSRPVHVSGAVRRWLAGRRARLEVFYLPGYSPELNPDQYLNQDVKSNAVGRRHARDQQDMIANVRGYLRSTHKQPDIVRSYFQEQHVRYAAV